MPCVLVLPCEVTGECFALQLMMVLPILNWLRAYVFGGEVMRREKGLIQRLRSGLAARLRSEGVASTRSRLNAQADRLSPA
jgi:hypothetical protein